MSTDTDNTDECNAKQWRFDTSILEGVFHDDPTVKAWLAEWNRPKAIARRKELGFHRGTQFPPADPNEPAIPNEPFLRFLHFEFASRSLASDPNYLDDNFEIQDKPGDPFENIRTELNEAADKGKEHPDHAYFKFKAINSTLALATVHRWAKKEGKSRSHFYRKLADLIDKQEVQSPKEVHCVEEIKLLRKFESLVRKLECLPTKDQLDKALNTTPTLEGTDRTNFNRRLKSVGLNGLPDRKKRVREPGPVRNRKR